MAESGKILIADDEEVFLSSTADLLRREGYECDCASDASTVVELLNSSLKYDLLISDINMSGNPELELVKDLPKIAKGMPVVLVTAYPSINSAIQSIKLPVVAYMIKPFDFKALLTQVKESIENYRTYRTVCGTQRRLQDWNHDIDNIEKLMNKTYGDTSSETISAFFTLTLRNIVDSLLDLRNLTDEIINQSGEQYKSKFVDSSDVANLKNGLIESIDVLEKTKRAFKSKDLGELRKKLKSLLKDVQREDPFHH